MEWRRKVFVSRGGLGAERGEDAERVHAGKGRVAGDFVSLAQTLWLLLGRYGCCLSARQREAMAMTVAAADWSGDGKNSRETSGS